MERPAKKIVAALLALQLLLSCCSCAGGTAATQSTASTQPSEALETTVPVPTTQEPTAPETTEPIPETTVPETTVPETTVPDTTEPETTVPETTEPETVPETTVSLTPEEEKEDLYARLTQEYDLPIVSIYTQDSAEILSRTEYVSCSVDVINCGEEYRMDAVSAGIRVRGNSSAYYGDVDKIRENKAPYRIKFEEKQNMLGLNDGAKCKSWVLLKSDWDLIRNDIALRMGRAIMDGHGYCSDSTFVHLYVNGEFFGVYLLCEQSQVNKNRVDIYEPAADETTSKIGYLLELDNYATAEPDNHYFSMDYAQGELTDGAGVTRVPKKVHYSIKSEVTDKSQVTFIKKYLNNLYEVLYNACVNDRYQALSTNGKIIDSDFTSAQEVAESLLDLESVVNMYILYEIVCDHDCGEGSFYMCIDFTEEDPRLQFTCPWDFDWCYDITPDSGYFAAAFCSEEFAEKYEDRSNPWFILLMQEDWFVEMVQEKWARLRTSGALEDCLNDEKAFLSQYKSELAITGEDSAPCARAVLKWIRNRIEWLDTQWLED